MEPDESKESVVQIDRHDILVPPVDLDGIRALPVPRAVIFFAHGSGSSRLSTRNTYVVAALNQAGLATVLFDLLTHFFEEPGTLDQVIALTGGWIASHPGPSRGKTDGSIS